jgi:hypothetical protein
LAVQLGQPYFAEYEAAVDVFQRTAGIGAKITAIRSPRETLAKFRAAYPHESDYAGVPIEPVEQNFVSVRGTTIAGHDFEWPELE